MNKVLDMPKIEWTTVNISKGLAARIREVIKVYEIPSVAGYVQRAVERRLEYHETEIRVRKDIEEEVYHGGS